MKEHTTLDTVLFLTNMLPSFLVIFVFLFFHKNNLGTVKSFKIFFYIVLFLAMVSTISCIWLIVIKSERANPPFLEIVLLFYAYVIHKEINRRKNDKPPLLF